MRQPERRPDPSVLIVEDDADLMMTIQLVLSQEGFRVRTAMNGREALERVEEELPGVILLDMRMPVMDGWEFSRRFHERYDNSVPIIVNTAAEDVAKRAREVGADAYVGKPFDLDELISTVRNQLSRVADKKPIAPPPRTQ